MKSIGKTIADAMAKVGKEGVITVEEGQGLENELEVVEGMQFECWRSSCPPTESAAFRAPRSGSADVDEVGDRLAAFELHAFDHFELVLEGPDPLRR